MNPVFGIIRQISKDESNPFSTDSIHLPSEDKEIIVNGKCYISTDYEVPKTIEECHVIDTIDVVSRQPCSTFSCLTCIKTGQRISMSEDIILEYFQDFKGSLKKAGYYPLDILIDIDFLFLESCKKSDWLICQDDPSGMREIPTWDFGPIGIHAKETLWVKIQALPSEIRQMIESDQRIDIFTNSLFEKFYVYEHRPMSRVEINKLVEFNNLVISLRLENPEEIEKFIPEEIKDRFLPLISFSSLISSDPYNVIRYNDIYRPPLNIFYDVDKLPINHACKLVKTGEGCDSLTFVTEKQPYGVFVDEYFKNMLLVIENSNELGSTTFRWYKEV